MGHQQQPFQVWYRELTGKLWTAQPILCSGGDVCTSGRLCYFWLDMHRML
jgi:hypothetical protein